MTAPCPACTAAEANPISGIYRHGCQECAARQLARSLEYAQASAAGRMLPAYMASLRAVFGDGWSAGHQRVKGWALKGEV